MAAPEQLLVAQRRAVRVWTGVHNMELVQKNVYPEAAIQATPATVAEVYQPIAAPIPATEPAAEIINFPINKLEAERLAVQAALQQAA